MLAQCAWHMPHPPAGAAQVLDLWVHPDHRRQGHGRRMMEAMLREMKSVGSRQKQPIRRAWVMVRQKDQVGARAFLTALAFHHVASVENLFQAQEGLVYLRAFD